MVSLKPLAEQVIAMTGAGRGPTARAAMRQAVSLVRGRSLYGEASKRPLLTALALMGVGLAAGAMMRSRKMPARRASSWQPYPEPPEERHSPLRRSRPQRQERPQPTNTPKRRAAFEPDISPRWNGPDSTPVATTSPTGVSHF